VSSVHPAAASEARTAAIAIHGRDRRDFILFMPPRWRFRSGPQSNFASSLHNGPPRAGFNGFLAETLDTIVMNLTHCDDATSGGHC
jgi:hypothetical protein